MKLPKLKDHVLGIMKLKDSKNGDGEEWFNI